MIADYRQFFFITVENDIVCEYIETPGEKPQADQNIRQSTYTEYYASTSSPKLKKTVNIKKLIPEEVSNRHALP